MLTILLKDIIEKINNKNIIVEYEKRKVMNFCNEIEQIDYINIYSLSKQTDISLYDLKELVYDYLEEKEFFSVIVDYFYFDWVKENRKDLIKGIKKLSISCCFDNFIVLDKFSIKQNIIIADKEKNIILKDFKDDKVAFNNFSYVFNPGNTNLENVIITDKKISNNKLIGKAA
ncbi:MAG: hypothetical protein WC337_10620 [Candidatus Muiribacteriota bacterium]